MTDPLPPPTVDDYVWLISLSMRIYAVNSHPVLASCAELPTIQCLPLDFLIWFHIRCSPQASKCPTDTIAHLGNA